MLLHMLVKKILVLFSCKTFAANKAVWSCSCMLPFHVIIQVIFVHGLVFAEITFKVWNRFHNMCFFLMTFKCSSCLVIFSANCAFVQSSMLILHVSADGAHSQVLFTNVTLLLFFWLALLFRGACSIVSQACTDQLWCNTWPGFWSVNGHVLLQLHGLGKEGAFWTFWWHVVFVTTNL